MRVDGDERRLSSNTLAIVLVGLTRRYPRFFPTPRYRILSNAGAAASGERRILTDVIVKEKFIRVAIASLPKAIHIVGGGSLFVCVLS